MRAWRSGAALPSATITKLRDTMQVFLRANAKFPDYCDVGIGIFFDVYDWHVKNQRGLVIGRQPDGRYGMQFMFTRLLLRYESDALSSVTRTTRNNRCAAPLSCAAPVKGCPPTALEQSRWRAPL